MGAGRRGERERREMSAHALEKLVLHTHHVYTRRRKDPALLAGKSFVLQISIMNRFWNKYHVICDDSSLISFLLVQSSQHLNHIATEPP